MLYSALKTFHIIEAAILLASLGALVWRWFRQDTSNLFFLTGIWIFPLCLLQLISGFYIVFLKHYSISNPWLAGSMLAFLGMIASWFGFVFFTTESPNGNKAISLSLLTFVFISIVSMVFFMANQIP